MIAAALTLMYLAIFKEIEPVLLLPIGFGCLLANIPLSGMTAAEGMMVSYMMRASRPNCSPC